MQKPHASPGTYCPLWRKDVSKVCHTCELYDVIPVHDPTDPTRTTFWGCTIKHQTFVLRDLGRSIEGLQKAEESFRNSAWKETQQNLADIVETVKHQNAFNGDAIRRIGDGFSELARAVDARALPHDDIKRINGNKP